MLGEPLSLCDGGPASDCEPLSLGLYGDPDSRRLDAVWMSCTSSSAEEHGERRLLIHPYGDVPQGARVLGAKVRGGRGLVLLESEAVGSQPAGLRGVLALDFGGHLNGNVTVGWAASGEPGEVLAQALIEPDENELFGGRWRDGGDGHGGQPPPAVARSLESWVEPEGLAIEEVWQGVFRRETARISRDALARWPQRAALLRALWNASPYDYGARIQRHTGHRGLPYRSAWTGVDFAGTTERPTVRAVSVYQSPWTWGREKGQWRPRVVEAGGSREALEAYMTRQPVVGRVVGHAPLGPAGGTIGLFAPGPEAAHGLLVVAVDGSRGAVLDPWEDSRLSVERASRVDVRFVDIMTDEPPYLLVRVEWPDRPSWTSLAWVPRVLQGGTAYTDAGAALWLNRAATIDEGLAFLQRTPHQHLDEKEASRVMKASCTRDGFLSHSTADAVLFTFRGSDPFAHRSAFQSRDGLTDADVDWLPDPASCEATLRSTYLHFQCMGQFPKHHVWFVREGGQLRIAAAARQLDEG